MKVLLLKDVYKLGRAGDVKKVANGYGRNFLLPQGLAVLSTPGALAQAGTIREEAEKERAVLNKQMEGVAKQIEGISLYFAARAGETGKLYGSITAHNISDALNEHLGSEIVDHRHIETPSIRNLGEHKAEVRLTMDLIPVINVVVYREGESIDELRVKREETAVEDIAEAAADIETEIVESDAIEPEIDPEVDEE